MGLIGDSLDMPAGVLVHFTSTIYPGLVIGAIFLIVVARGAFQILKLSK